jgi:hypothetical protein
MLGKRLAAQWHNPVQWNCTAGNSLWQIHFSPPASLNRLLAPGLGIISAAKPLPRRLGRLWRWWLRVFGPTAEARLVLIDAAMGPVNGVAWSSTLARQIVVVVGRPTR